MIILSHRAVALWVVWVSTKCAEKATHRSAWKIFNQQSHNSELINLLNLSTKQLPPRKVRVKILTR